LVAIGVVWGVVVNLMSSTEEEINSGGIFVSLEVKDVTVNANSIDVKVKRNAGSGDLDGLKFLVSDGVNSEEFEEETTMGELSEKTFSLSYSGLVKSISVAPIYKSGKVGSELDIFEFESEEILENLGAVSWWRLDGNAHDEIGENHGTISGADCSAKGKFGEACLFDGDDDYVRISDFVQTAPKSEISISFWVNVNSISPTDLITLNPLDVGGQRINVHFPWWDEVTSFYPGYIHWQFGNSPASTFNFSTPSNLEGEWNHFVFETSVSGSYARIYQNGIEVASSSSPTTFEGTQTDLMFGSALRGVDSFDGILDEVIIFNRALSEEEINSLYNLDLR
jgi:hypothetical protein